jgi:hypothetical protein
MTFAGHVGAADTKAAMEALLAHLEHEPCRLEVDLRRVTGFSLAGGSIAQRAACCRLLGLGCTVEGALTLP